MSTAPINSQNVMSHSPSKGADNNPQAEAAFKALVADGKIHPKGPHILHGKDGAELIMKK
jgi:hypothetical protein